MHEAGLAGRGFDAQLRARYGIDDRAVKGSAAVEWRSPAVGARTTNPGLTRSKLSGPDSTSVGLSMRKTASELLPTASATKSAALPSAGVSERGVWKDNLASSKVHGVCFAEVEVDVETGHYRILDYLAVADVGTVIHPNALGGQVLGRSMLGIAHAIGQKWVYDQHYGVALARRFHHNRPPTILDAPQKMQWASVDLPDPETPIGARGIGELGSTGVAAAVAAAVYDAVGVRIRDLPITPSKILTRLTA